MIQDTLTNVKKRKESDTYARAHTRTHTHIHTHTQDTLTNVEKRKELVAQVISGPKDAPPAVPLQQVFHVPCVCIMPGICPIMSREYMTHICPCFVPFMSYYVPCMSRMCPEMCIHRHTHTYTYTHTNKLQQV